jgi:hypothetical protein
VEAETPSWSHTTLNLVVAMMMVISASAAWGTIAIAIEPDVEVRIV